MIIAFNDPWSDDTASFTFTVDVFNNPCTKGFRNVPATPLTDTYTLNSGPYDFSLGTVDNTECTFVFELYTDAAMTLAAPTAVYSMVQPTF